MRSHAMRLYPLTELHDPKAIELFITEEDANRALGTVCPMSPTGTDCFGSARSVCSADLATHAKVPTSTGYTWRRSG